MFNKSAIFKSAHGAASYYRKMFMPPNKETYAVTFSRMLKDAWYKAQLNAPANEIAPAIETKTTPELEALKFEHYRRDLSSNQYFGSPAYKQAANQIRDLQNQIAA